MMDSWRKPFCPLNHPDNPACIHTQWSLTGRNLLHQLLSHRSNHKSNNQCRWQLLFSLVGLCSLLCIVVVRHPGQQTNARYWLERSCYVFSVDLFQMRKGSPMLFLYWFLDPKMLRLSYKPPPPIGSSYVKGYNCKPKSN